MAVANGFGKVVTSGSVFMYDVGDTYNSYLGEPTTNVFKHYGTTGQGSAADNAVNFDIQGTTGFIRLGYGQTFGGYTIQPNDVVYKYNLGSNGCHYHGNTVTIPSGKYATFSFDYYVSPGTTIENSYLANFENYGGSALGGGVSAPNSLTGVWQTVTLTLGPTGGSGTQAMFLYPGGCGPRFGNTGYILYKNPQVEFLPHKTPFTQTSRSVSGSLLPLIGNSTIDLSNVSFDSNAQMVFDGTNDYINIPSSNVFDIQTVTVEVIVKPYSTSQNGFWFEKGAVNTQYSLFMEGSNIVWRTAYGGTYDSMYFGSSNMTANAWNHVVGTYTAGDKRVYLNSTLMNSNGLNVTLNTNQGNQYIGSYNSNGYFYNGEIAVVKVYNRVLTASEITQNYNKYKTRFNLS
jgi:hypothetical protein